jgi:uncharacterized membrane protein
MRVPLSLSLLKTITFAITHFVVAFTVAYLLTGSIAIASALALIEPLANTVAYFFHERAWAKVTAAKVRHTAFCRKEPPPLRQTGDNVSARA